MSAALYRRRLYWDTHRGVARADGVTIDLRAAPLIEPILRDLVEIDYTPEVHVARVREGADGWREMNADEAAACEAWLHRIAHVALEAAHQPETGA